MDQESFRKLLQTPRPGDAASQRSRGNLLAGFNKKSKKAEPAASAQPEFKPRKVQKETDSKYRDRAAERRKGDDNDFSHVEAVLKDFEQRAAEGEDEDDIAIKSQYLGGDSEHTVLVKGLDFALLEQNRAKAAAITTDDIDALEAAFQQGSGLHPGPSEESEPHAPATTTTTTKKKTKAELLKELKKSRAGSEPSSTSKAVEEAKKLEAAKQMGKFKPIGFKPIGSSSQTKEGKKKSKGEAGERKKKRRKVEETAAAPSETETKAESSTSAPSGSTPALSAAAQKKPEPVEEADEDFDIFGGVEEYNGLGSDDEDSEGEDTEKPKGRPQPVEEGEGPAAPPRKWFDDIEEENLLAKPNVALPPLPSGPSEGQEQDDDEEERPMRLQALESSVIPSIKELLAMDDASDDKKGKKKRKRGGKKKDKADDDDD